MPRIRSLLLAPILTAACIEIEPIEPLPTTHYAPTSSSDGTAADTSATGGTASGTGGSGTAATAVADETATGSGTTAAPPPVTSDGSEGPCTQGGEGCPCTAAGTCDPGLQCLSGFCVDPDGGCNIGSEGCPCTMGGGCDPGLECISDVCVEPG
jgi:hypothetical protein